MSRLCVAFVLIALSGAVTAADPFVGTYRLNAAKSGVTGRVPNAEQTLVISEDRGNLVITTSGTRTDGSSFTGKVALPMKGGTARRVEGDQQYDAGIATRTTPNAIEIVTNAAQRITYALSADGKVLTWTVEGTNPQGQQVKALSVFERQ